MRKRALLAAAAGMALTGSLAKADFTITWNRVPNGAGPGLDQVFIYAQNNGGNTSANPAGPFVALGDDVTLTDVTSGSGQRLRIGYRSTSATAPEDFTGKKLPVPTGTPGEISPYNPNYSYVNLLGDISGGASGLENDPTQYVVVTTTPAISTLTHASVPTGTIQRFEVAGANLSGGVVADSMTNFGSNSSGFFQPPTHAGALIAVAVLPSTDDLLAFGQVGGDQGNPVSFQLQTTFDHPCPEPCGASLAAVGFALLPRRWPARGAKWKSCR